MPFTHDDDYCIMSHFRCCELTFPLSALLQKQAASSTRLFSVHFRNQKEVEVTLLKHLK